ncbi:MAG: hypothetical protein IKI24_04760 [Clostridia bacterium]|nr:hypothetical protein [Clostridia bacterium]MCR4576809.1 hypothetical protein [Clostridiales bacterium]
MPRKLRQPKNRLIRFLWGLEDETRRDRRVRIVYQILRLFTIITLVSSIVFREYESAFICVLCLILFLIPGFLRRVLRIRVPEVLQIIILLFIFAAEMMGELFHFFTRVPGWDTILHTLTGFLMASVGLSLVDLLNSSKAKFSLSPAYMALVAFCFAMTIGVLWEFFEFGMDVIFRQDMQNDMLISRFTTIGPALSAHGDDFFVTDVVKTVVETAGGEVYSIEGGYYDIGLYDTMKDLIVTFAGAAVFSVIGYFSMRNHTDNPFAQTLMLTRAQGDSEENTMTQEEKHDT